MAAVGGLATAGTQTAVVAGLDYQQPSSCASNHVSVASGSRCAVCCSNFNYPLECYAYGCPRIGNLGFVKEYNLAVPRTFQVQVDNDVVAQLPPFLGYKDVSNECRIMDGGRLEVPEGMPLSLFGVQPLSDAVRPASSCPPPPTRHLALAPVATASSRSRRVLTDDADTRATHALSPRRRSGCRAVVNPVLPCAIPWVRVVPKQSPRSRKICDDAHPWAAPLLRDGRCAADPLRITCGLQHACACKCAPPTCTLIRQAASAPQVGIDRAVL